MDLVGLVPTVCGFKMPTPKKFPGAARSGQLWFYHHCAHLKKYLHNTLGMVWSILEQLTGYSSTLSILTQNQSLTYTLDFSILWQHLPSIPRSMSSSNPMGGFAFAKAGAPQLPSLPHALDTPRGPDPLPQLMRFYLGRPAPLMDPLVLTNHVQLPDGNPIFQGSTTHCPSWSF